jgi:hypothetical protein
MPYGPGKFEGEPASTFLLYQRGLDGDFDEDFSQNFGWWARFNSPLQPYPDEIEASKSAGYTESEIQDSLCNIASMAGAIIHERNDGFVYGEIYTNPKDLDEQWNRVTKVAEGAAE